MVASSVTTGTAALRSTWWRTMNHGVAPRATAAVTYGSTSTPNTASRVVRAVIETARKASTHEGRTIERRFAPGSVPNGVYPPTGRPRAYRENTNTTRL